MNTRKIITLALLATLATACGKDKADCINIFANNMGSIGTKVWVNPTSPNDAIWVVGETINLNGNSYTINSNSNGSFSLNVTPLDAVMYAIYPASTNDDGNIIDVVNNNASGATITMKQLAVNFLDVGHRIIFPMAEKAAANSGSLYFDHLTAGLRLTLANTSTEDVSVDHIKVVVQGTSAASDVVRDDVSYTVRWAVQGPTTPSGDIGGISGNQQVAYSSEMHFQMQHDGQAGVTVPANGSISFCVPATVSDVKMLSIPCYNAGGMQLFTKVKNIDNPLQMSVNYMYNIPSFDIK